MRHSNVRGGVIVLLVYAVMALVDGLGVLSARAGLAGISSTLFFLWFLLLPLPVGFACNRSGSSFVMRKALIGSAFASVLLVLGAWSKGASVAGFCLAGMTNVCLQVAVPIWVAERFSSSRLAGVVTGGLFSRTLVAVAFPFVVSALADWGCWWLSLVAFAVLSVVAGVALKRSSGEAHRRREAEALSVVLFRNVLRDPVVSLSVLAFAIAIVADVVFNLAVPDIVANRFGRSGASVGIVYAVWFGVKLPLMLAGSRLFLRYDARRFFVWGVLVSLVGAVVMLFGTEWWTYLVGVGLFAAGFANVYGHVFGAAAPRHPKEVSAVSALLVMAISAGALASPVLASVQGLGHFASETLVLVVIAILVPVAALISSFRNKA